VPAVVGHSVSLEKIGIPVTGIVTSRFVDPTMTQARTEGMPNLRTVFTPHPISGRTVDQLKSYVIGKNPVSGKQIIQEIVDALTVPLSEGDLKTGFLESKVPQRLIGPMPPENLQRLFTANGWTDGLPIVLPTEERVRNMLKGTSYQPGDIVGKMSGGDYEPWELTVEQVAVNAVMAGARSEYFPVILAVAASGISSFHDSPDSLVRAIVVNGPIRDEIEMNYETGALGPFNQANATIGRAWNLISRNLANAGIPGETYSGSLGNNLNYNNIVIAENEERSPWDPLSIQKGFHPGDSVVSIFTGLGLHAGQGARRGGAVDNPEFDDQIRSVMDTFTGHYGSLIIVDPLVARELQAQGYATKEKLSEWLHENSRIRVSDYREAGFVAEYDVPRAEKGIEPYATWLNLPDEEHIPRFAGPDDIHIVVTGGETKALFQSGNLRYLKSVSVDEWR
jgi:hypothetical protein